MPFRHGCHDKPGTSVVATGRVFFNIRCLHESPSGDGSLPRPNPDRSEDMRASARYVMLSVFSGYVVLSYQHKVVKLGPGTETSNVKVGDRVGIKWMAGVCGNCIPCLASTDACW